MNEAILSALRALNGDKDTHWTKDGKPSLEMVRALSKDATVTREMLDSQYPNWNRTNVVNGTVERAAEEAAKTIEGSAAPGNEPAVQPLPAVVDNSQNIADAVGEVIAAEKAQADAADYDVERELQVEPSTLSETELVGGIEALDSILGDIAVQRERLEKDFHAVNSTRDKCVAELEKRKAKHNAQTEQENIMEALNAGLRQREEAFKKRQALIAAGVNTDAINAVIKPVNPIDAKVVRR